MYPVTPEDIWRHYAALTSKTVRPDGSPNPLAMPEPFDDAKKLLENNPYDIAILDIMGVSGYDVLELARKKDIPAMASMGIKNITEWRENNKTVNQATKYGKMYTCVN